MEYDSELLKTCFQGYRSDQPYSCCLTTGPLQTALQRREVCNNRVLKEELGPLFVGLRGFHEAFFGSVVGLEKASEAFFAQCTQGTNPTFDGGWRGWPRDANEADILSWFTGFNEKLAVFAETKGPAIYRRRPLAQPYTPIRGFIAERKINICFVNDPKASGNSRCSRSQILMVGELRSNPIGNKPSKAWLDLGRYVRKVLAAQDSKRFTLGFTLCMFLFPPSPYIYR